MLSSHIYTWHDTYGYSWIGGPKQLHIKSICQATDGATIDPRPALESPWKGEYIGGVHIFASPVSEELLLKTCRRTFPKKMCTLPIDASRRAVFTGIFGGP